MSQAIPTPSPVVYALRNKKRQVIYVGLTTNLELRIQDHRKDHGTAFSSEILQSEFINETPREAERKWICRYHAEYGHRLRNLVGIKPPRQRSKFSPQSLGGKARSESLTPNARKDIARKGALAMWKKRRQEAKKRTK